jgi:ribosomal protein L11 methyltransferase
VNNTPTYAARLVADETTARRIANLLAESFDPLEAAASAFAEPGGRWQVEAHFAAKPEVAALRALVATASDDATAAALTVERVAPRDWVKQSLKGLKPIRAGRFIVHGAHDHDRVPSHSIGIEIEAAQAFGTGHHGTTRGCLIALDDILRRHRPGYILDLGTGSGVLAIAAALALHAPVLATDIDATSVQIARDNARRNRVGSLVTTLRANGLNARQIAVRAPFDLVFANILLAPLLRMIAPVARTLMPGARLVFSGLLPTQANAVIAAGRAQGLALERRLLLDGWVTLSMVAADRSRG